MLALRDEIALVEARLNDLLGQLGTGESGEAWEELQELCWDMQSAVVEENHIEAKAILREISEIVQGGLADQAIWHEVYELLERRRRLTESERKRLVNMHQIITVERAMVLIHNLQRAVIENVSNPDERMAIAAEFRDLTLRTDS